MADLLKSLVSPNDPGTLASHLNSSQESFQSAAEVEERHGRSDILAPSRGNSSLLATRSNNQPTTSQASASSTTSSLGPAAPTSVLPPRKKKKSGQLTYDADAYFADPANVALLENRIAAPNDGRSQNGANASGILQPIELGTQTSHYVSRFYHECQIRGLAPVFEIDEDGEAEAGRAKFRGVLRLNDDNDVVIRLDEDDACGSKKKVRERLAERGLEVVRGMDGKKKGKGGGLRNGEGSIPKEKEPNWVGMLQEYFNLEHNGTAQPPVYTFYSLGLHYACTVTLLTPSPDQQQQFGSPTDSFPSKKQAQRNAAAAAVQFLISEGKLNSDGSTLARKSTTSVVSSGGSSVRFSPVHGNGKGIEVVKEATYAQRINDIAPMLGLSTPVYQFHPESINAPNILSGYVSFPNSSRDLPARVCEVRHVFGKKAAKEEAARGAWEVLIKLAEKRGVKLAE